MLTVFPSTGKHHAVDINVKDGGDIVFCGRQFEQQVLSRSRILYISRWNLVILVI